MINIITKNMFLENEYYKTFQIGDYAVVAYDKNFIRNTLSDYIEKNVGKITRVRANFGYCGITYDDKIDGEDTHFIDFNDIKSFKNKSDAEAYLITNKYNL